MRKRTARRSIAVVALAATLLAVAGCDTVKAGAKCRNGSAPGRDATHVLFCQGGKWKRVLTIGQAADFIVSSWPTQVELVGGGGQTTGIGSSFAQVVVRVTRKDGSPASGADVVFEAPSSGASLATPKVTVATDAQGYASFTPVANNVLGGYAVSATVNGGYAPYVVFGLNNAAGAAASIAVVSGGGQSAVAGSGQFAAPVVVKAVDRAGNTLTNTKITFSTPAPGVWFGPAEAFAADDGLASTNIGTGNVSGAIPITATVAGTSASLTFDLTVVAGAVNHDNDRSTGSPQSANPAGDQFPNRVNNPLNIFLTDTFGNAVVGEPVQYTIVPNGGASGTFDVNGGTTATFLVESDGSAKARLHGNGVSGTFTVTTSFAGQTQPFVFTITNP